MLSGEPGGLCSQEVDLIVVPMMKSMGPPMSPSANLIPWKIESFFKSSVLTGGVELKESEVIAATNSMRSGVAKAGVTSTVAPRLRLVAPTAAWSSTLTGNR